MNLNYSDEEQLLRDSALRFVDENYSFDRRKEIAASAAGYDTALWRQFAELGWTALPLAEANGGLGGDPVSVGILMEALGRGMALEPFLSSVVVAGGLVEALGDDAQRAALLAPLIAGESTIALAHSEAAAGDELAHVETTAVPDGAGYRISGGKTLVLGGASASTILVSARLSGAVADERGIGVFVVPATAKGLAISPVRLVDGSRAADIHLNNVRVGREALLGASDDALGAIEAIHDRASAALSSEAVGAMDALLGATVKHVKDRTQFGKPLAAFQALQHRIAEMAVKCEEVRAIALLAALSLDGSRERRVRGVSGARVKIARASRHVAHEAIQIHGAMGFTEEMPVGTWFKRLFAIEMLFGTSAWHLARYAAVIRRPGVTGESLLREAAPV